ncbi:NADPH-dependent ferric siderophore reductase [Glaciihabitans tibetensis]|uniref:NADPH-dependent ferric siderophore reductase n=1 Tax=Glaciihabitans tibetensis TaxID=1266600 RepID=A0A2T0VH91_9MICO|nr:siderophore-interacting protein [Glaciihabitans tibetensis]PRY69545.1 NADPH-dependent ferric siderophore reductase [Glaciihabitans tibetensis]
MSTAKNTVTTSAPAPAVEYAPVAYSAFAVVVANVRQLGASFLRVTFRSDELAHFLVLGLDQRIKLVLPNAEGGLDLFPRETNDWYAAWRDIPETARPVLRTYTARTVRPELGEIDVDFVVHGRTGPATRWVLGAAVGDEIFVIGPDARTRHPEDSRRVAGAEFAPGTASRVLLAGDETAAPAICSILESLPKKARGQVFIEVPTTADILPVASPGGVTVCWLARDARPGLERGAVLDRAVRAWVSEMMPTGRAAASAVSAPVSVPAPTAGVAAADDLAADERAADELAADDLADDDLADDDLADDELAEINVDTDLLWEVPDANGTHDLYAWIAGEAGCIKELRRFLVRDSGLHRSDVAFMGYWRLGKSEN